jgi:hypothetical protein
MCILRQQQQLITTAIRKHLAGELAVQQTQTVLTVGFTLSV